MTTNDAFTVQVEHDGIDTTEYTLLVNGGVQETKPVDPGGVAFVFPAGAPAGTYTLVVIARGPGGETPSPEEVLIIAHGVPSAPKIVIVIG